MNKTMKLTPLGKIANRHSVQTPLKFWSDLLQEIRRIEDRDGDWEQMVDERIQGLQVIREHVREYGTGV